MDKAKFRICVEIGCPHPRYLDLVLTERDYKQWMAFLMFYHRQPDGD